MLDEGLGISLQTEGPYCLCAIKSSAIPKVCNAEADSQFGYQAVNLERVA